MNNNNDTLAKAVFHTFFDAAQDIGKWYDMDYDTSLWEKADIICSVNEGAYGILKNRMIPQSKDYGLKDYENSKDFEAFATIEDTMLKMKLPYNAQVTTYLKVSADKGKRISIKSDTYDDLLYDTKRVMSWEIY